MPDKRRLNLAFSMASPLHREAWEILAAVPAGRRTDAICHALCLVNVRDRLLDAVRQVIREELGSVDFIPATEKTEQPQAGGVYENVLGFMISLQGDEVEGAAGGLGW